jgi:hypothetical protein
MKFFALVVSILFLSSCAVKEAYTKELKEKLSIDTDAEMRKLQFYTSGTIILEEVLSGTQEFKTDANGVIIPNSTKVKEKIIIPANTKCIFEGFGPNGELIIRFETGVAKTLTFAARPGQQTSKYYLVADWSSQKGGELKYGNETYITASSSGNAHLMVVLKKLQRTKRKDRIVKGMKV